MSRPERILVVDPDPTSQDAVRRALSRDGYDVLSAIDGTAALASVAANEIDLVIMEVRLPEVDGLQIVEAIKRVRPTTAIVFLTMFGTIEDAVRAIKGGAYDFVTKPFRSERLLSLVREALERRPRQHSEHAYESPVDGDATEPVGRSRAFRRVMELVAQVAPSAAAVLIRGESGSGKELVARTIHRRSPRRSGQFVVVKCEAQPERLLEAELFGSPPDGSLAGASVAKQGAVELADKGTLFLDEVADLPPAIQTKLLAVIEDHLDVRVIAATACDAAQLIEKERLRKDLFYRLSVVTVDVPPLRERREDIPALAQHFLSVYAAKHNRVLNGFTAQVMRQLTDYAWPGNIRELQNVMEGAVVLAKGSLIDATALPEVKSGATTLVEGEFTVRIGTPIAEVEQRMLEETLRITGGNKTLTAKLLGIDVRTVARKLERS